MLKRLLSLTLIAALLECPFICGLAPVVRAQEQGAARCCGCCHHEESIPADQGSAPADPSQGGNAVCQCICNGAVIEHAAVLYLGIALDCWTPVAAPTSFVPSSSGQIRLLQAVSQPDDGTNPGRAMRCLFSTYLC
jgi:hypothetical protein